MASPRDGALQGRPAGPQLCSASNYSCCFAGRAGTNRHQLAARQRASTHCDASNDVIHLWPETKRGADVIDALLAISHQHLLRGRPKKGGGTRVINQQ